MAPACATSGQTAYGMRWEGRPASDRANLDRMAELTAAAFRMYTGLPASPWSVGALRIWFADERVDCTSADEKARGERKDCHGMLRGRDIFLKDEPCLAYTSMAHELLHFFALLSFGHYDATHSDERLWIKASMHDPSKTSAEEAAIAAAIYEGMCD